MQENVCFDYYYYSYYYFSKKLLIIVVDGTSFVIFYVTTLNDEWSTRNRQRNERQRVADDVAAKIASRFEAPHTTGDATKKKNDWESRATITILTCSSNTNNSSSSLRRNEEQKKNDNQLYCLWTDTNQNSSTFVVEGSLSSGDILGGQHPLLAEIDKVWSQPPESVAAYEKRLLQQVRQRYSIFAR